MSLLCKFGGSGIMNNLPTAYLEPCIFRNTFEEPWKAGIFTGYKNGRFFSGEGNLYKEMAPLQGNEKAVGKVSDAFCLMDQEWLEEEGLL